jgi:hypothetical protein
VESAIVLPALVLLIFGMLDLSLALFRQNILSEAARRGARLAIVHGQLAPLGWDGGPWGPTTIDVKANTSGVPLVSDVEPVLVGCDLSQTDIKAEWIDGGNAVEQRVRITITTPYQPMILALFGEPTITLSASSTMPIAH